MKKCKLIAIVCLLLVLVAGVFSSPLNLAAAETGGAGKMTLDMVILLDISHSMSNYEGHLNGTDPNGYRYDAAVMLLGLCDSEASRAAIVPFGTDVYKDNKLYKMGTYADKLYPIGLESNSNRARMREMLVDSNNRGNALGGQTALGEALSYAVNMLCGNRSENRPVVVLLTDGDIYLNGENNKEDTKKEDADHDKFLAAQSKAKQNGITVYTIALKPTNNIKSETEELLRGAANITGGEFKLVTDAQQLPDVFNSFFASMIDSRVEIPSSRHKNKDGSYEVTIHVPNMSVAEMNALIPVGTKGNGNYQVYKPDGTPVVAGDNGYVAYQTAYYTFIKVAAPITQGDWKITYGNNGTVPLTDNVDVKVVFGYSVMPQIEMKDKVQKTAGVNLQLRFFEPNGNQTRDSYMYRNGNIEAKLTIKNLSDIVLLDKQIVLEKAADCYLTSFVPADCIENIRAGRYKAVVTLQGDGMDTSAEYTFEVENQAPYAVNTTDNVYNPFANIEIHDPTSSEYDMEFGAGKYVEAGKYVVEPDDEMINFTLGKEDDAVDVIKVNGIDPKTGLLQMETTGQTGEAVVHVLATDPDGALCDIPIKVNVKNIRTDIIDNYRLKFESNFDWDNRTCTYTARLYKNPDATVRETNTELLKKVEIAANCLRAYKSFDYKSEELDFVFDEAANEWNAKIKLSNNECVYTLSAEAFIFKQNDINITVDCDVNDVHTNSIPTKLTPKNIKEYTDITIRDPFAETYLDVFTYSVDLSTYVSDADNQNITYILNELPGEEDVIELSNYNSNTLEVKNGKLDFETTGKTGKYEVKLTAKDEDNAEIVFSFTVNVYSVRENIENNYIVAVTSEDFPEDSGIQNYSYIAKLYANKVMEPTDQITDEAILGLIDFDKATRTAFFADGSARDKGLKFERSEGETEWMAGANTEANTAKYKVTADVNLRVDGYDPIEIQTDFGSELSTGNREPQLNNKASNPFENIEIFDPTSDENEYQDKTIIADMSEFFYDEDDGQKLTYSVKTMPDENLVELDEGKLKNGQLVLTTRGITGSTSVTVTADDGNGGTKNKTFSINIENLSQTISEKWSFAVEGPEGTDPVNVDKNGSYTYTVRLIDENGDAVTDSDILKLVRPTAVRDLKYHEKLAANDVTGRIVSCSRSGDTWTLKADTGANECEYILRMSAYIGYPQAAVQEASKSFKLINSAPKVVSTEKAETYLDMSINDPTDTKHYDKDEEYPDCISRYFVDSDKEALTYSCEVPSDENGIIREIRIEKEADGSYLVLKFNDVSGNATVLIKASDPEGAEATKEIPVKLTSVRQTVQNDYTMEIVGEPVEKNGVYTYTATLRDERKFIVTDSQLLRLVSIDAVRSLDYTVDGKRSDPLPNEKWELDVNKCVWTTECETYAKECVYGLDTVTVKVGDITLGNVNLPSEKKLDNHAPEATGINPDVVKYTIFNPLDDASYEDASYEQNMYDFVKDADKESLKFTHDFRGDLLQFVNIDSDGNMTFRTNHKTGSATIKITAEDPEGEQYSFSIPVEVEDVSEYIARNYVLVFTAPEEVQKNTEYTYNLKLVDSTNERIKNENALNALLSFSPADLKVKFTGVDGNEQKLNLEETFDSDNMTITCMALDISGSYKVEGTFKLRDITIATADQNGFEIVNTLPAVIEEAIAELPEKASIDPFLWARKDELTTEIDLSKLFSDSETEKLNYFAAEIPAAAVNYTADEWAEWLQSGKVEAAAESEEIATPSEAVENDASSEIKTMEAAAEPVYASGEIELQQIRLTENADGIRSVLTIENTEVCSRKFLLWAQDADAARAVYVYDQKVNSQKEDLKLAGLKILIAAIAFLIVYEFVYWTFYRKNWTRKHGSANRYFNSVPKGSVNFPNRGKSDYTLLNLSVTDAVSGTLASVLRKSAGQYKLRAGKESSVIVMASKKTDKNLEVKVGGIPVRAGRKVKWNVGADMEITLKNDNSEVIIEYKRQSTEGF